jgi:iron complex outermembrane receptor protein
MKNLRLYACLALVGNASVATAADHAAANEPPSTLPEVRVTAGRIEQSQFDAPASVHVVDAQTLQRAGPLVNLSEALAGVPGLMAITRNNYAQDVQISIRGFGARSPFGLRGIRLITDGIPATIPDGQGQASTTALTSADRVEVITGPLAQLYGNAAGGVIQTFTREATEKPEGQMRWTSGSYGLRRTDWQVSGRSGQVGLVADLSTFETDGFRANSAARRTQFNSVITWGASPDTRLRLVVNLLDLPLAQDPLGLTQAQVDADPSQAGFGALANRTRKTVRQNQLGAVLEHRLSSAAKVQVRAYAGRRETLQFQTGSWIGLDRHYQGVGLQVNGRQRLQSEVLMNWAVGFDYDQSAEQRQGGGVVAGDISGNPSRNELNVASNRDLFGQVNLNLGPSWTVTAGMRASRVGFTSRDDLPVPDDGSGSMRFRANNPALGVTWHASDHLNLYANWGRGLETPTLSEAAYSNVGGVPTGQGLNTALRASRSRHAELGAKWQPGPHLRMQAAWFHVKTGDEIVTDVSASGRTAYKNASRTKREGLEFSGTADWNKNWLTQITATAMTARYEQSSGAITAGNDMPGIARRQLRASLVWAQSGHSSGPQEFVPGLEVKADWLTRSKMFADDANLAAAPAFRQLNLQVRQKLRVGIADVVVLAAVENVTNQQYIGSVIINQAGRQYFEPGLPRNWRVGVQAVVPF